MPDGASISRLRLSSVIEVTRGTTPANPPYAILPIRRGSSASVQKAFERSSLIRSDRQGGQQIGGTASNQARLSMPLLREDGFMQWMRSALSNVEAVVDLAGSFSFTSGSKTMSRAAGSFLTDPIADRLNVGDVCYITGTTNNQSTLTGAHDASQTTFTVASTAAFDASGAFRVDTEIITYTGKTGTTFTGCTRGAAETTAASHSNGAAVIPIRRITAITATDVTFGNNTVVTEAALAVTVVTLTKLLLPGTSRKFYSLEQFGGDINVFEIFKGVEANTAAFTVPTSGEVGVEFGLIGTRYALGQVSGSTYAATLGNTPAAASAAGSSLLIDGATINSCVESLNFNINNNRAAKFGVGEQFACFVEEGDFDVDLSLVIYWVDATLQTKFQNETRFALALLNVDQNAGHKFRHTFPRLVPTQAPKGESGQTITEQLSAFAEYDPVTAAKYFYHHIQNIPAVL